MGHVTGKVGARVFASGAASDRDAARSVACRRRWRMTTSLVQGSSQRCAPCVSSIATHQVRGSRTVGTSHSQCASTARSSDLPRSSGDGRCIFGALEAPFPDVNSEKNCASRIAHARSHVPVRLMARLYGQWRGSVRRANDTMAHALAVLLGKISGISTRRTDGESASIVTSERTSTSLGFIEPFATSI